MLTIKDIKALNIEVSSRCTARCPFCSRLQKVRPYGSHLISFKEFKKLPLELITRLRRVTFAGNFGDFSTNPDVIKICSYLKSHNPKILLGGDTNGMVQPSNWWAKLGESFQDGELIFSLDGLEDTHSLYRVGTKFSEVMTNLSSFIKGGGAAHWKFIVFKHNEHQVAEAAKLAEEIGCKRFLAISSRDYNDQLLAPVKTVIAVKRDLFKSYGGADTFSGCKPVDKGSIYIAADGTVHPCCFAHCMYITEHNNLFTFILPLIERNIDKINFKTNSLESILAGEYFQETVAIAPTNSYCHMKCSKHKKEVRAQLVVLKKQFTQ